jgi:hypothetical protein
MSQWSLSLAVVLGLSVCLLAASARGQGPVAAPASAAAAGVADRAEVSQYGITWKFDKPAKTGQFITGDWWVVGPVTVASVTPAPGPVPAESNEEMKKNRWGDTSLRRDYTMRNGSMVVLKASMSQGYDSRSGTYDAPSSIAFPYALAAGRSLISTISNPTLPVHNFCKNLMWASEQKCENVLKTAAVLTCLPEAPPADAFRPPYVGTDKPIWRAKDIQWELLPKLKAPDKVPSWEEFERYFQRPWLEHVCEWPQQQLNPNENQPNYGREHSRLVSIASLMLQLDVPKDRKQKLLIGLVQYGIDVAGAGRVGGQWNWGGGHSSGRKWPVVFASLMLGDANLRDLPPSALFHEDTQTYYGKGWFGQTALWQMVIHHGPRQPYEERPPEQWTDQWDKTSESYRLCCNGSAWIGTALAAREMKAIKVWEHDAYFDYCDRWMRPDDPYAAARGTHARPTQETKTLDPFVDAMWHAYRTSAPQQEMSGKSLQWVPGSPGKWIANPKPADGNAPA